jgi:hypothetical protein
MLMLLSPHASTEYRGDSRGQRKDYFYPEDGGRKPLRNMGYYIPIDMAS